MAIVSIRDYGTVFSDPEQVRICLANIGIEYEAWPLIELPADADGDTILNAYRHQIETVKMRGGYNSVDVVSVSARSPGLDEMLAKFNREHWHDEDEVRFTIVGRGLFHIHPEKAPVTSVEVGPGDMIRVPRGTHHWFNLCGSREIKTIRFFQDKSGWTPHYTGSSVAESYEPVCFGLAYFPRQS